MTRERVNEIERLVIYRNISSIISCLEDCNDTSVIFNIGRIFGKLQDDLLKELNKEVEE